MGHLDQESESLAKNIVTCFEKIQKEVPGGLENLRNAQIKCGNSLAVPLFVSYGKNSLLIFLFKLFYLENVLN